MHHDTTDATNPYASPRAVATTDRRPKPVVLVAGTPDAPLTATLIAKRWNYRVVRLRGPIDADIAWNGWFNRVLVDAHNKVSRTRRRESSFWFGYDFEFDLQTPFNTFSAAVHVKYGFLPGAEARLTVNGMLVYCDRQELGPG